MRILLIILAIVFSFKLLSKLMKLTSIIINDEAFNSTEGYEPIVNDEEPQNTTKDDPVRTVLNSVNAQSIQKGARKHKTDKGATSHDTHNVVSEDKPGTEGVKTGENSNILSEIANNFDLRSAVIYSEIMTPKFKENE